MKASNSTRFLFVKRKERDHLNDVKIVDIHTVIPYEKNPRKNDEAVKYVANSIKEFGFKVPKSLTGMSFY